MHLELRGLIITVMSAGQQRAGLVEVSVTTIQNQHGGSKKPASLLPPKFDIKISFWGLSGFGAADTFVSWQANVCHTWTGEMAIKQSNE